MRVLFFIDYHDQARYFPELSKKAAKADLIISAGDHTIFEYNNDTILSNFDAWGKPILLMHGNHERSSFLEETSKKFPNITFVHGDKKVIDGNTFLFWGGGGLRRYDPDLAEQAKRWKSAQQPIILVTHAPPYNTKLDDIGTHAGNATVRDIIERFKPIIAISGHLHETEGREDTIGPTRCINPGPMGVLIDL